jgi:hypothetical protein
LNTKVYHTAFEPDFRECIAVGRKSSLRERHKTASFPRPYCVLYSCLKNIPSSFFCQRECGPEFNSNKIKKVRKSHILVGEVFLGHAIYPKEEIPPY